MTTPADDTPPPSDEGCPKSCGQAKNLSSLIEDRLTDREQAQVEAHLETCTFCQTSLDNFVNGNPMAAEVAAHLRDFQPSSDATLLNVIDRMRSSTSSAAVAPVRLDDFAVDYLHPTDNPDAIGRLGQYEISGLIGSGGMGIVLRGHDDRLNRVVAIKVLSPMLALNSAARRRFMREAQAAAAVGHAHVVTIHSVDEDRLPYLVMEYVDGITLQQRLDTEGFLQLPQILRIGVQVSAGLAAAHAQGLVHRDIKPSNILLENGMERVKLTDFGLARAADDASVTRDGTVVGTPEYMSPEQARAESVDQTSDLFSLGSVLYTLATGRPPFRAETCLGVMRKISEDRPVPIRELNAEIPIWLVDIIERLMAKDKSARFSSAREVHDLLQRCLNHTQQPTVTQLPQIPAPQRAVDTSNHVSLVKKVLAGVTTMIAITLGLVYAFGLPLFSPNPSADPSASPTASVTPAASPTTSVGDPPAEKQQYEAEYMVEFDQPGQVNTLNVDIKRGIIHVVGYDGDEVLVKVSSPNYLTASVPAEDGLQELRPNTLDFEIEKSKGQIKLDGNSYVYITNLQIQVPRKTNLILDSYGDGYLHVEDVEGQFNVRGRNNDIKLVDVSGAGRLWSYNGNLTASLKAVTPDAPLELETYNGSINLSLPAATKADVRYRSGSGRVLSDLRIALEDDLVRVKDNSVSLDEFVSGRLNGGGAALTLETEKGDIRLRRRMPTTLR